MWHIYEKLEHVWSCLHTLSKPWENFMFSTTQQHKAQFTHLFVTNLTFIFMWFDEESTKDIETRRGSPVDDRPSTNKLHP